MNQNAIDYIKNCLANGLDKEAVKKKLLEFKYPENEVDEAFRVVAGELGGAANAATVPGKLAPLADLLSDAWDFYVKRFRTFTGIIFLPILISLASGLIGFGLNHYVSIYAATAVIPLVFLGIIFYLLSSPAMIYAVSKDGLGILDAYRWAAKNFHRFYWMVFLSSITIIGGSIMGIVPGIIFSVYFSLAAFIFVEEDLRGWQAILKSRQYVRGYWWPTALRIFAPTLALLVVTQIINVLNKGIAPYISIVLQLFLAPFLTVFMYLVYKNFKLIKPLAEPWPSKFLVVSAVLGLILILALLAFIIWVLFALGFGIGNFFRYPHGPGI